MTTTSTDKAALIAKFTDRRSTGEERERSHHRERIAQAAINGGKDPRDHWTRDDLDWLFDPDELALLVEAAAAVERERERRATATAQRTRLRQEHDKVKRELVAWNEAVIDAEARRRLGWPATGLPPIEAPDSAPSAEPRPHGPRTAPK